MQQTFYQLQPTWLNLNNFLAWLLNIVKWVFSLQFFAFMYVLTAVLVIALITLILYVLVRMYELRQEGKKQKAATMMPATMPSAAAPETQNTTWQHVREQLLSNNDSDWKLAIIEADIYLDKVLDGKGFHGDTTSDKLKQVTPDKLPSIQLAWEAHKIRNRIAHDGTAFVLTMPEARRLLSYFEIVFTDLGVI